ncbi:MAG: recombinase RecA [Actinomycetota bacterium]
MNTQGNGMTPEQKAKALDAALGAIGKQFGGEAIMRMGESPKKLLEAIPTGVLPIDIALGIGGLPKGRIIEMYGPESSGKTTVALHVLAQVQAAGGVAAFIDAEHALDPTYAQALGCDLNSMLVSQPDSGEQALEIVDTLARSQAVDLIVIDSVAALTPRAEIDGEMGDSHVGLQARLMSQGLRKLAGITQKGGTTIIFINQLREKIGVMFGSPETTPGGEALKFYASVRIDIRRIGSVKDGDQFIGNRTKVKIVKNKVAPPFKVTEFTIVFGRGAANELAVLDLGVEHGVIRKAGAWYSYDGEQIGQGAAKSGEFLLEHPEVLAEIELKVREAAGLISAEPNTGTDDAEDLMDA